MAQSMLGLGVTSIWFEKDQFEYVEGMLRLARNELRYRGVISGGTNRLTQRNIAFVEAIKRTTIDNKKPATSSGFFVFHRMSPDYLWLPGRDAQQKFFTHNFGFLLNPVKKNHPRTEYMMVRLNSSVLTY